MVLRRWLGILGVLTVLVGCNRQPVANGPKPGGTPTPQPTPTPLSVAGSAETVSTTLFDADGKKVFEVTARSAGIDPGGGKPVAGARGGSVTLYREGKPQATMTADDVSANRDNRTVTAKGNVAVKSLDGPDAPTARADEVTWTYDKDTITGQGNVLITNGPGWEFPAASFKGNTALRSLEFKGDGRPATGLLKPLAGR